MKKSSCDNDRALAATWDEATNEFNAFSQRIAEAIEAVLKIDITIVNSEMVRIAGTGRYKEDLYGNVLENTAFGKCMNTGGIYIVEDTRNNPICVGCDRVDQCEEKADICVPIKYKEQLIGVIGAIAFTLEQKQVIISNKDLYSNFIQKMASFIEAKYSELQSNEENKKLTGRMENILNSMKQAVVFYDEHGEVLYQNHELEILLHRVGITDKDSFIKTLWHHITRSKFLLKETLENVEVTIHANGKNHTFLADIVLSHKNQKSPEYLITLNFNVSFESIVSVSSCMEEVKSLAKTVSLSESNILLEGESGTGKEIFARAIHNYSHRREKPFIALNCGAIPDMLLESELFGYEKGAFTGADKQKLGKFEIAEGGTLFLDEVGDLPFRLQVKLLRVLQEKEICRLGAIDTKKIDVRIISATNSNLMEKIRANQFREDLYYRLNIIPIHLPPLRDRAADLEYLTQYYINHYSKLFNKQVQGLTPGAKAIFKSHTWPGNIRELQNVLEYAVCLETDAWISEKLIKGRLDSFGAGHPGTVNDNTKGSTYRDCEKDGKRSEIIAMICSDLKISRATFYRKLRDYAIPW